MKRTVEHEDDGSIIALTILIIILFVVFYKYGRMIAFLFWGI